MKCNRKKIMILGASILQLPAIQKALEMNLEVIAVDMNPEAVGFKVEGVKKEIISTIDIPAVVQTAKKHNINGIMTLASDMPMRTVAVVAKKMGLVGIDEDTAIKATNKAEMRNALKQNNVPIPLYYKVENEDEFVKAVNKIKDAGFKCIVKPADNSGSRGIDLLSNFENETLKKAYEYSKKYSRSGSVMVEEYMEGHEVSVETLSVNGKCYVIQITDKITTGAPYFVEMGHSQPSQLDEETKKRISQVAIDANKAIGIKNGPSHTEIKVTKDGPKIVEIGARLGGDNITSHLVPLSTGIDMVGQCIKIAMGEQPQICNKLNKASAVKYFETRYGTIKSISGIKEAEKVDGIKQIEIVHNIGAKIDDIKSSNDRVGFVIAQADNTADAIKLCDECIEKIEIEIEE